MSSQTENDGIFGISPKRSKFESIEIIPQSRNYGRIAHSHLRNLSFEGVSEEPATCMGDENIAMADLKRVNSRSQIQIDDDKELDEADSPSNSNAKLPADGTKSGSKFGTFDGVLGRCVLCMWGVIMFLRTGWIVGQAGIFEATMVMMVSASVTFLTTLSLCAIVTNGMVQGGGPYFFISRSLGPQWGGPVGILFAFANCVGVSLHLAGFAEAILSLYWDPISGKTSWAMTPKAVFDIQIIGAISLVFLVLIAFRGVGSIIKFNLLLLFVMMVSILAFIVGTFTTKPDPVKLGFTGYKSATFASNWRSAYKSGENFLTMIALFFPSVTGCMAGANISGDLKNPERNIPVGTVAAVLFSVFVYIALAWMLGASVLRESTNGFGGLNNDYLIMSNIGVYKLVVDLGIYASTFSSATSCFVAAPRILQAVCADGLFPRFNWLAKGRKSDNEPLRCYILVLVLALAFLATGNINVVAPLVTNFFMVTYALVNYSVYTWEVSKVPGWRPSFQFYHKWVCLFAAVQCVVLMFLISWKVALATFVVGYLIYLYVGMVDPDVAWGTTNEARVYAKTCSNVVKYQSVRKHAKTERPTFLILNINKFQTTNLYKLAKVLNYSQGLMMIGDVLVGDFDDYQVLVKYRKRRMTTNLEGLWSGRVLFTTSDKGLNEEMNKACLVESVISASLRDGFRNILQLAGMGGLKPNVCMFTIPFDTLDATDYENIAQMNAYKSEQERLVKEEDGDDGEKQDGDVLAVDVETVANERQAPMWYKSMKDCLLSGCGVLLNVDKKEMTLDLDSKKVRRMFIDVWWIYDDGGMTLLLAYLFTKNKLFEKCHLRIMSLESLDFSDKLQLINLMNKLRIRAEIKVIGAEGNVMETINMKEFKNLKKKRKKMSEEEREEEKVAFEPGKSPVTNGKNDGKEDLFYFGGKRVAIPEAVQVRDVQVPLSDFTKQRFVKYFQIAHLIEKQCELNQTELVLVTMPYPRLEYKWFEYELIIRTFIKNINAPLLFVRGNQDQVLITDF